MRRVWRKAKPKDEKKFAVNAQIKAEELNLIDENGENVGIKSRNEALRMAEEAGLDLVEVNPKGVPPVAKIMDFGQFKYEKEKQAHKQKVQQKKVDIKGIRLSVRISSHDFNFRIDQAVKFFKKGHKLKLELVLKGREKQHPEKAVEIMNEFTKKLEEAEGLKIAKEQDLTRMGGRFTMILVNQNE